MTSAIKKALPQILASTLGAMIGAAGLYLATSAEATVAADQVTVDEARLVIEQERMDVERWDRLIRNLDAEVNRLSREVGALREENRNLRVQIGTLTAELYQARIAKEIKVNQRAEADRMEPRDPAPIEEEQEPDSQPLPKRF